MSAGKKFEGRPKELIVRKSVGENIKKKSVGTKMKVVKSEYLLLRRPFKT